MFRLLAAAALLAPAAFAAAPPGPAFAGCSSRVVSVADDWSWEGGTLSGGHITFTVSSVGCAAGSVSFAAVPGGAPPAVVGVDFAPNAGVLSWPEGDLTSRTITIDILGDPNVEADERFALVLFNPSGLVIGDGAAVGTIRDDDVTFAFKWGKPFCDELCVTCWLVLETTPPAPVDITVRYTTRDGTATAGSDYTGGTGSLTIRAGGTSATLGIAIHDDRRVEGTEFFTVDLYEASSGDLGAAAVEVRIVDSG